MRNYILVDWIRADLYDDQSPPVFSGTVYAPDNHGYDGNGLIDAYMTNFNPTWTTNRSSLSTYVLVSSGWIVTYLVLSGPLGLVVSDFVFNQILSSEHGIVGSGSPKYSPNWGYPSDLRKKR